MKEKIKKYSTNILKSIFVFGFFVLLYASFIFILRNISDVLAKNILEYIKVLAWPAAEIAVMGAEQAVNIINRSELAEKNSQNIKSQLVTDYTEKYLNPYVAAKQGKVDMIIEPKQTRIALIKCLEMMISKREKRPSKKHGNMPL